MENQWSWEPEDTEKQHAALIQQASEEIANGESGVVFVAVTYGPAKDAVTLLRRTGVNPVILGGTSFGSDFPQLFRDEPEEKRNPGFFTNNTYFASQILLDSASQPDTRRFSHQLRLSRLPIRRAEPYPSGDQSADDSGAGYLRD